MGFTLQEQDGKIRVDPKSLYSLTDAQMAAGPSEQEGPQNRLPQEDEARALLATAVRWCAAVLQRAAPSQQPLMLVAVMLGRCVGTPGMFWWLSASCTLLRLEGNHLPHMLSSAKLVPVST